MALVTRAIATAIGIFRDETDAIGSAGRRLTGRQVLSLLPGVVMIGLGVRLLQLGARARLEGTELGSCERHEAEHHEPLEAISP